MNKKSITIISIVGIGAVALAFYGGAIYGKAHRNPSSMLERGQMGAGTNFNRTNGGMRTGQSFGGFTAGEIISKDDTSITVKLPDGGSKIVFFSGSTPISKSAAGSAADLSVGENVTVTGQANQDGSVSAQSIQIGGSMMRFGQQR